MGWGADCVEVSEQLFHGGVEMVRSLFLSFYLHTYKDLTSVILDDCDATPRLHQRRAIRRSSSAVGAAPSPTADCPCYPFPAFPTIPAACRVCGCSGSDGLLSSQQNTSLDDLARLANDVEPEKNQQLSV